MVSSNTALGSPAVVVVVALCCAAMPAIMPQRAWAQDTVTSAGDKETARSLMRSGDGKLSALDYQGALQDYRAADMIMSVPTTRVAVSRAQDKLGLLLEARDTALTVGRMVAAAGEPPAFAQARAEAAARVVDLAGRIPSIAITISGLDPDAVVRVVIDETEIRPELLRVPRKVNPGTRQLVVSAAGYETQSLSIDVSEGEAREVPIELRASAAAPAPAGAAGQPAGGGQLATADERADPGGGLSPLVWVGFGVGAAGNGHTCALLADGTLRCWGTNQLGQLGDGTFAPHTSPVQVTGL